jgi:uncharacterized protein YbjT (DUF2867 family)
MEPQTAVVIGASGLIGSNLLNLLLADNDFKDVRILVRKNIELVHPKLVQQLVNFQDNKDLENKAGKGDCLFCTVGTTQQKVKGDKAAYRRVDFDIPVNAAKHAATNGFQKYLLVSSVGANAQAKNFYLKLKGEVEEEVSALPIEAIHIFQPSMLLGNREEFRAGELVGKAFMEALSFAFLGSLKKYKAIQALDVAKAMVAASKTNTTGVKRYQYSEMHHLL